MGSGLWRRLRGDLYLGYRALVVHPLKKALRPQETTGLEQFLLNYGPEGLVPTSAEDRRVLEGASRCIHCGLCDAFDPILSAPGVDRRLHDGASLLPLQYSRATPELPHAVRALSVMTQESLERAEAVCPTRVPLRDLAAYLRRKLAEVEAAKGRRFLE